jgi:hypothetical protein
MALFVALLASTAACASAQRATPAVAPRSTTLVDDNLDPNIVAAYIKSQLPRVKDCYDTALLTNRDLAGRVVMVWTIDLTGATQGITVESNTMQEGNVAACVEELIRGWRFPAPKRETVEVTFPFVFQMNDQQSGAVAPSPATPS